MATVGDLRKIMEGHDDSEEVVMSIVNPTYNISFSPALAATAEAVSGTAEPLPEAPVEAVEPVNADSAS